MPVECMIRWRRKIREDTAKETAIERERERERDILKLDIDDAIDVWPLPSSAVAFRCLASWPSLRFISLS